jgi:hypothetical protein
MVGTFLVERENIFTSSFVGEKLTAEIVKGQKKTKKLMKIIC